MTKEKKLAKKALPERNLDSTIVREVPEKVEAYVREKRGQQQPREVKKVKIKQGHKGYKNFMSWS